MSNSIKEPKQLSFILGAGAGDSSTAGAGGTGGILAALAALCGTDIQTADGLVCPAAARFANLRINLKDGQ